MVEIAADAKKSEQEKRTRQEELGELPCAAHLSPAKKEGELMLRGG